MALKRCIVLVDGVEESLWADNLSNIDRIRHITKTGKCTTGSGEDIFQDVLFYQAADTRSSVLRNRKDSPLYKQIRSIVKKILDFIDGQNHEVFLFGSGDGAFVIRAVAGVLYHMGMLKPEIRNQFEEVYDQVDRLIKARFKDDHEASGKSSEFLSKHSIGSVNIVYMGLFHATGLNADSGHYETAIVPSVKCLRHATAWNETSSAHKLHATAIAPVRRRNDSSRCQAWFLGSFSDICGGAKHDGLSLYPLQWILLDAISEGLFVAFDAGGKAEECLKLVFPGHTSQVTDHERPVAGPWEVSFVNGIVVSMYDLQDVHVDKPDPQDSSHTMALSTSLSTWAGDVVDMKTKGGRLKNWDPSYPQGHILHPSVLCICHRNPDVISNLSAKTSGSRIPSFQSTFVRTGEDGLLPWMNGPASQVSDNQARAFRILVCGKTGVGKSTLINKVFGVELTEESETYAQGVHDIDQAFESPNHPGLLIHDSRGWQAGSDSELDLIAQFLRKRAFQTKAAEVLHMIWFCIDADVSRIEEADKRTFATIAEHSNHVPVFVVGTKKDKLVAYHKMRLLDKYMEASNDYHKSNRMATEEAEKKTTEQFLTLKDELSKLENYKADGFICLSKVDDSGIRKLLQQTVNTIVDEQVRIFCVAAQVVDVDQKIESAVDECMRLGKRAIRTSMVPLPLTGMIGTPTVSRLICEHTLQCFGFPKAVPEEVEKIMSSIVSTNLKQYMAVTLTQVLTIGTAAVGIAVVTMGIGSILLAANCLLSSPPTARMLLQCSCDMILILERSFRYGGRYVSTQQIEDAARQYVSINMVTKAGKEKRLQDHVHQEINKLIPLKRVSLGFNFGAQSLKEKFERIVYDNRFDLSPEYQEKDPLVSDIAELGAGHAFAAELPADERPPVELEVRPTQIAELPAESAGAMPAELAGSNANSTQIPELPGSGLTAKTSTVSSNGGSLSPPWTASPISDLTVSRSQTVPSTSLDSPLSAVNTNSTTPKKKSPSFLRKGFQNLRSKTTRSNSSKGSD